MGLWMYRCSVSPGLDFPRDVLSCNSTGRHCTSERELVEYGLDMVGSDAPTHNVPSTRLLDEDELLSPIPVQPRLEVGCGTLGRFLRLVFMHS